jgi:molybdenum cofactor cytidylyltransferase
VILAAGASRRLGTPKQRVQFRGETLLGRAIRIAREAGLDPLIVVLGAEREAIRAAIEAEDVLFVENDRWHEGIASSMRAGLESMKTVASLAGGVLIMACDQPQLSAEHLRLLVSEFSASDETCIVSSMYAGVRGVPAVFPRSAVPQLTGLTGDVGARKVLANPPCRVIEIAFAGGEIDIDSPPDLAQLD